MCCCGSALRLGDSSGHAPTARRGAPAGDVGRMQPPFGKEDTLSESESARERERGPKHSQTYLWRDHGARAVALGTLLTASRPPEPSVSEPPEVRLNRPTWPTPPRLRSTPPTVNIATPREIQRAQLKSKPSPMCSALARCWPHPPKIGLNHSARARTTKRCRDS